MTRHSFPWLQDRSLTDILSLFQPHTIRIVGGAVRDSLMGYPVCDIDLATSLPPDQVMAKARRAGVKVVPTGLSHGTVTLVLNKKAFEITTLRRDLETDGRRAQVSFTDSWQEDARRRDFTVNALSVTPDGILYDYFGGQGDCKDQIIRFIGNPDHRIQEDYLRILRYFRFAALRGKGQIQPEALKAIKNNAEGLSLVAAERQRQELYKILSAEGRALEHVMAAMSAAGINPLGLLSSCATSLILGEMACHDRLATPEIRYLLLVSHAVLKEDKCADPTQDPYRLNRGEKNRLKKIKSAHAFLSEWGAEMPVWCETLYYFGPVPSIIAYLLYQNVDRKKIVYALDFIKPSFPLSAQDLLHKGVEPGATLGLLLRRLELNWVRSGFHLEKADLIDSISSASPLDKTPDAYDVHDISGQK